MATQKVAITLPEEMLARLRALAREQGLPLSTYLAEVTHHHLRVEDGLAAMREWIADEGSPSPEAERWVDDQLARAEAAWRTVSRAVS
ncbi:MAG: hypothetical protein ACRD0K_11090 [Egibacteraceae bacterium]